jgi:hypothetical protein
MRLLALAALLLAGCSHPTGREHTQGRLRCVQLEKSTLSFNVTNLIWQVSVDGKPYAEREWSSDCYASPNPKVEALVLSHDVLRFEGDKPKLDPLEKSPEHMLWACDGHCVVFGDGLRFVETGEDRPITVMWQEPIALAPDAKTVVSRGESNAAVASFCVRDLETKAVTQWTVPKASGWLVECTPRPYASVECEQKRTARFAWHREPSGRDALLPPDAPGALSQPSTWETCGRKLPASP